MTTGYCSTTGTNGAITVSFASLNIPDGAKVGSIILSPRYGSNSTSMYTWYTAQVNNMNGINIYGRYVNNGAITHASSFDFNYCIFYVMD